MRKKSNHRGSNFDDFLKKEGLLPEVEALAFKKILAWELEKAMKIQSINKSEVAKRMHTSRAAFDRLLDPTNISITLKSLEKAAFVLGKRLHLELQDAL